MQGQRSISIEKLSRMMRELLRSDREWIFVPELAKEIGVSRATAYRYLTYLEAAGWPIERDLDTPGRWVGDTRGIRSLLVAKSRAHSESRNATKEAA